MRSYAYLMLVLIGCDGNAEAWDASIPDDAGRTTDAAVRDAGSADAAVRDAAVHDAGVRDAAMEDADGGAAMTLPPVGGPLDYQLGGAYPPPSGVTIVVRDRGAAPAEGLYNICYVNGFQVQPHEERFWLDDEPDLILRSDDGEPVIDEGWDEMLLDVSTSAKRERIAIIVGEWIAGCKASGFDAIEIDNLDSFSRSGGRLDEEDAVSMMALFAETAHALGMAIAQKNAAELVPRRAEMGTDFVVAEECNRWDECDVYTASYGAYVLVVEYRRQDFDVGCASFPELSIVLRDLNLVTPSSRDYVYDGC